MVRSKLDRLLQGAFPDLKRLIGKAIDEIDRNRLEPGRSGDLDAFPGLLRRVPAPQELQRLRIEGLDSKRQENGRRGPARTGRSLE